ncbi:hypothetical protein Y032_0002g745 [Ancylostoma ceylanicum]|nr:hypothetical protein Y032_0002g745 [Ancylostoma ceylanicum]
MCSSSHEALLKKREEDGCTGAVAFANVVCGGYFHCTLGEDRSASECIPKICKKFNTMPKNRDCFHDLFNCD